MTLIRVLGIHTIEELEAEVNRYGNGWDFVGNDEFRLLKITIAWAFPGKTPYDDLRVNLLSQKKG